jgi:hypothetical protein
MEVFMDDNVMLTVIELMVSIIIEGVILSMVFAYIANISSEKQNTHLKNEMSNIETQNKFIFEQICKNIENAKTEIISQIKESSYENGGKDK